MPIHFGFKLVAVCKVGIGSKSLGVRSITGAISLFHTKPFVVIVGKHPFFFRVPAVQTTV
jgi:hypothetical protein